MYICSAMVADPYTDLTVYHGDTLAEVVLSVGLSTSPLRIGPYGFTSSRSGTTALVEGWASLRRNKICQTYVLNSVFAPAHCCS